MVGFTKTTDPTIQVKLMSAGLAGCIGDVATFPLDVAKVRLQIQGEGASAAAGPKYRGMLQTMLTIARQEGPRALYNGLTPGLQRQVAFCTVRIGLYDSVKATYINAFQKNKSKKPSDGPGQDIPLRILAGITTGGMAVLCAQPTDVVKVRMQAQTGGPRYRGSLHAYQTIAQTEGIRGLWRGVLPNVARNSIVNAAELVSYDYFKETILYYRLLSDSLPCHVAAGFGAGFVATILASPVDVVKTRFMNSAPGMYSGAVDCAVRMYRQNGSTAFYKGCFPSFLRIASWNIVMFVCFEQLKRGFMQVSSRKQPDIINMTPRAHAQNIQDGPKEDHFLTTFLQF